jgi:hypothetical protein
MKVMAILTVIVGGLELVNIIGDFVVGHGGRSGGTDLLVGLVALAAIALIVGGVALLRRQRAAARIAGGSAFLSVLVFGGIAAFHPFISIAASMLGIAFPLGLLAFLFRGSARVDSHAAL